MKIAYVSTINICTVSAWGRTWTDVLDTTLDDRLSYACPGRIECPFWGRTLEMTAGDEVDVDESRNLV